MTPRTGGAARSDPGIQSLRGLAVVLMVAGHVIGSGPGRGLEVADDSAWRLAYSALEDVRMPLFTVMSGFVYAYRPARRGASLRPLVWGKTRRLLVPMVVVGTTFFLVQAAVPGTNHQRPLAEMWTIYVLPYEHFWFLQAIFLIFILVGALDTAGLLTTNRQFLIAWLVASCASVVIHVPAGADVFSVNGALRLLPFFLLGYWLHRSGGTFRRHWLAALTTWLVASYALKEVLVVDGAHLSDSAERALSLSIGAPAVVLLVALRHRLHTRLLAVIGGFSFGVYLLHVFGTAGVRLTATAAGMDSTPLLFALSLAAGIAGPIVIERAVGHLPAFSWGVLGQRPLSRMPAAGEVAESRSPTGDGVR